MDVEDIIEYLELRVKEFEKKASEAAELEEIQLYRRYALVRDEFRVSLEYIRRQADPKVSTRETTR